MWRLIQRVEPRPNARKEMHPLDVHALPQRLRGEVEAPPPARPARLYASVLAWLAKIFTPTKKERADELRLLLQGESVWRIK